MSLGHFAERVLVGTTLEDKLSGCRDGAPQGPRPVVVPERPGRPPGLGFGDQPPARFPGRLALAEARGRGQALHFFANHELLALELMALALLKFPGADPRFRGSLMKTMEDEQSHLRLYLGRMAELGVAFGDFGVSSFFWAALKDVPTPQAFVAGLALTLEQANLDFSAAYRDLFAAAGDAATARVLDRVYRDEVRHVQTGLAWFERWRPGARDLWDEYVASLALPLSPARAKARPFNRQGRLDAGLAEPYVKRLELFGGSKGRPPAVLWYNPDVEMEVAQALARDDRARAWEGYRAPKGVQELSADAEAMLSFLAAPGDVLLCRAEPPVELQESWRALGVTLPEYRVVEEPLAAVKALAAERAIGALVPWGLGPRALRLKAEQDGRPLTKDEARGRLAAWYAKTVLPALRQRVRSALSGPALMEGRLIAGERELLDFVREAAAAMGCPVLVKAPYSAAGRERLKVGGEAGAALAPAQRAWLERAWSRWGALLAEPLVEVVADLSVLAEPERDLAITRFYCDARGQYSGHELNPRGLVEALPEGAAAALTTAATAAFAYLRDAGHTGRAGIDAYLYRYPKGPTTPLLQPLGEINPRTTMGHVAVALAKALAPETTGVWALRRDASPSSLAADLAAAHPAKMADRGRKLLASGVFFTNDPRSARHLLGVVGVGPAGAALRQSGHRPRGGPGAV